MKRRKENTEIFGAKDAPIDDTNMINDEPIIIFFLPNLKIKYIEFYYSALAINLLPLSLLLNIIKDQLLQYNHIYKLRIIKNLEKSFKIYTAVFIKKNNIHQKLKYIKNIIKNSYYLEIELN